MAEIKTNNAELTEEQKIKQIARHDGKSAPCERCGHLALYDNYEEFMFCPICDKDKFDEFMKGKGFCNECGKLTENWISGEEDFYCEDCWEDIAK